MSGNNEVAHKPLHRLALSECLKFEYGNGRVRELTQVNTAYGSMSCHAHKWAGTLNCDITNGIGPQDCQFDAGGEQRD